MCLYFLIMEIKEVNEQFKKLYKKYSNDNFEEINYVLSEILNKNILEIKLLQDISLSDFKKAKKIIVKHLKTKKPYQKIFKKSYFYGLEFFVNKNVLTPRSDSEVLVENALKENFKSCLDLCSGSGCLGLSIKYNKPEINLTLADYSRKALKVSKINAKKLNIKANIIKTNMFSNINDKYDLIVCNPPYIETETIKSLSDEVKKYDPIISLDGGEDGYKFYKIIYNELNEHLNDGGVCFLEIGYNQGNLVKMFKEKYKNVTLIKDYNNQDRVLKIVKE